MQMHDSADVQVARRGFLLAGLAGAVTLTLGGTTGLLVSAKPAQGATMKVLDVTGDYALTDAQTGTQVSVTVRNGVRRIRANGLPNHSTGSFPNAHNPNSISAQSYDFSVPAKPTRNANSTPYALPQPFGIAINGVLFDPFAAEWWDRSGARSTPHLSVGPVTASRSISTAAIESQWIPIADSARSPPRIN